MRPSYLLLIALAASIATTSCRPSHTAQTASVIAASDQDWGVYLGNKSSSQYSTLDQINRDNVRELEVAWTYRTGDIWDETRSQIQTNPLVVNGVLYGASPTVSVFALDAATGELLWRFDPSATQGEVHKMTRLLGVSRGLVYWEDGDDRRILFSAGPMMYALDAETGSPVESFGDGGRIDLRAGLAEDPSRLFLAATTPGVVYRDILIQGTRVSEGPDAAPGDIRAFDIRSGRLVWTFHTIPRPGEYGYDTWPEDAWQRVGGANNWAGMSLDEERGIVYIPTGSASFDFWGGNRIGQNLFANTLLALDAETGERIWHFQTVHHDIWDRDLPAPPNLVTVVRNGERIDAVAQVTKSGHVFVFDRTTGEPLFPIEERRVPASELRGEEAWPTQPFPVKPAPFSRQQLTEADLSDLDPEYHRVAVDSLRKLRSGGQFLPFSTQGTIIFPGFDGGAEWGGSAVDPDGILYVNANEMPWVAALTDVTAHQPAPGATLGERTYTLYCAACHGDDRAGGPHQNYPSLVDVHSRLAESEVREIVQQGRGFMPGFQQLTGEERDAVVAFLFGREEALSGDIKEALSEVIVPDVPFVFNGYHRFVDADGNPVVKPPWGTLNAIDLNTGEYKWTVTFGEFPEMTARGIPPTGAENYGGPVVTAGGILFIGATRDEMFRAFDRETGEVLWETKLPFGGYATPSTYMVDGKQYVVIAAGGGKMGTPSGDAYIAFTLPD